MSGSAPPAPRERATVWVLVGSAALVVAYYAMQVRALAADALRDDLGIHYYLSRLTSEGAVPLVDFEHGWNAGAWYFSAVLYRVAGGDPTLWTLLWGRAFGFVLAGLAVVAVAWRLRLEARWAAALVLSWMLVTHVPNSKYALPLVWLVVLLPVGAARRLPVAAALRAGLVAVVWWFHVELALLLGVGTALYDLAGARGLPLRDRVARAGAVGAGLAVGVLSQVAVYAAAGLGPAELAGQLLFGHAETAEANFGYPLAAPPTFRTLVYPASVVLAFVPVVWRRLSSPARLVAFLHLSLALIAIRRTDDNHVAAAATLLAVLAVLAIRDLVRAERPVLDISGSAATGRLARAAWVLLGAAWALVAVAAGFRVPSRLAIVALVLVCLAAVAAAAGHERGWASAGAAAAVALVLAGGLGGHLSAQVAAGDGDARARAIAAATRGDVEACLADDRRVWVVPDPLTLYDHLDLTNPTPFYLFWYTLEAERDRIERMLADGTLGAILQVGAWPSALAGVVPAIERHLAPCAEVTVPETGDTVRIWTASS